MELLRSDPELVQLQLDIRQERIAAEEAEVAEMIRQQELDDAIEGPLLELQQRGRLWAAWTARWWQLTAGERALQRSIERLVENLMWTEDAYLTEREQLEEQWMKEWVDIQQAERKRYRLITEWFSVWEEQRQAQWDAEREAHCAEIRSALWRMTEGKAADEQEIAKWEAEVAAIESRISAAIRHVSAQADELCR